MKHILTLLLVFAMALGARAGIGDWNTYLAYHDATHNIPVGHRVYSLYGTNLLIYDTETTEVQLLSKLDGLSDRYIAAIGYSASCRTLVVLYDNGNIDLLDADGRVTNIPQLKSSLGTTQLNRLSVVDDYAYVGTGEGVARISVARAELSGYYRLGVSVRVATEFDGRLFVATPDELRSCALTDNLFDRDLWRVERRYVVLNMMPFAGALYFTMGNGSPDFPNTWGLWRLYKGEGAGYAQTHLTWQPYTGYFSDGRTATFADGTHVAAVSADEPAKLAFSHTLPVLSGSFTVAPDGTYWSSNGTAGLQPYRLRDGALVAAGDAVGGYGPRYDLCYYMRYVGERLLVAGGRLDPSDLLHYPAMLAAYEHGTWRHFATDGMPAAPASIFRDVTSVAQDPADPDHHFATCGGGGLYEFRNFTYAAHYGQDNSPLVSAVAATHDPNYIRLDGLNYDDAGNLWMVNNSADSVLCILRPGGTWSRVYTAGLAKAPTVEKTLFGRDGRLWVASRRTVANHNGGLLGLDYNGTVDNDKDDVATYRSALTNQDGIVYSLEGVYALAEDHDGAIWVGADAGLFVVDNPSDWSKSGFYATQIKVPRNDGTNYADYLLSGVAVTALAVDGANRKWIGTDNAGLYLVSADGTEILAHFTAADSPLLSDCIYSLAINASTGEVMIGTDCGLCSYGSDASAPSETLDADQLTVFPNPVRPDYYGSVTITGLTAGADIKITTTGGQVVAAGTSSGGSFQWDVRDLRGERVSAGVYFVMAATADGKKGAVARIVVI